MSVPLLEIDNFSLHFDTFDGRYQALDGVSLRLAAGESLGVVGETGCGKSVTAKSILGLVPMPPGRVLGGDIRFQGRSLLGLSAAEMRRVRGIQIAMIFQDPMTYLNPLFSIGHQMRAVLAAHSLAQGQRVRAADTTQRALAALQRVHLPDPAQMLKRFPHQLSGGQRQRVLIAMALTGEPCLLIADEPTTALDVTIQAQILDLLDELQQQTQMAVLLISHDLGVIARICKRVAVMYAGCVVETAPLARLFAAPAHPYTAGLLASVPHPLKSSQTIARIPGNLPNLLQPPQGCRFHDRCPRASSACLHKPPTLNIAMGHSVACHHPLRESPHAA